MSRMIEDKAKEYLINGLGHPCYVFLDASGEIGFDLWMEDTETGQRSKIELKATNTKYKKPSDIFHRLYFSAKNEVDNFRSGSTQILRIFLGDSPPRILLMDNRIFAKGAGFKPEARFVIRGHVNYEVIRDLD